MDDQEFLEAVSSLQGGEKLPDMGKVQVEWNEALTDLFDSVKQWLKVLEDKGLASLADEAITITEPDLAQYQAPGLLVCFKNGREVRLRPVARFVLGGTGRVDLRTDQWASATKTLMFLRGGKDKDPTVWRIIWSKRKHDENEELDEGSFRSAFQDILRS